MFREEKKYSRSEAKIFFFTQLKFIAKENVSSLLRLRARCMVGAIFYTISQEGIYMN